LDLNDTDKASDDNLPTSESVEETIADEGEVLIDSAPAEAEEHVALEDQLASDNERIEDIDALYEALDEVNTDFIVDQEDADNDSENGVVESATSEESTEDGVFYSESEGEEKKPLASMDPSNG
jgi:hypothetical protein